MHVDNFIHRNKNKSGIIFLLFLSIVLFNKSFDNKNTATAKTTAYTLQQVKNFQAELDTLSNLIDSSADKQILIQRFKSVRIAFKKFECVTEYLDNDRYPFFNGVNAIEMEYGYNPDVKPEGLQVIESELFADTVNYAAIQLLIKHLKYRTLVFYMILQRADLQDAHYLEAIRFNLIRIETLSLVSFDSPDMRNNVTEIIASLKSIQQIISFYKDNNDVLFHTFDKQINLAIAYLSNKNFFTIDRLFFIKKYLQPITQNVIAIQKSKHILNATSSNQNYKSVNLSANTIYDENFLNIKSYAQDIYYPDNEIYATIGKKLFFDTRFSKNKNMSCATCHQPANFFTDNLPTAITNANGIFQQRNTPTLMNVALQPSYFYDLRANSLEEQISHVVNNKEEFNHHFDSIISIIQNDTMYVRLFSAAFPTYSSNPVSTKNINLCLADFERQLIFLNSPFDKYMRNQSDKLPTDAKRGFNLFMGKAQCGACHFAPTFFGNAPPFYKVSEAEILGITKTFDTLHPVLDEDIGVFKNTNIPPLKFAMKTSTIRNAQYTAPYMHNGGFKTLKDVIEFYNIGGGAGLQLAISNQTLAADRLNLTKQEKKDIIAFIQALSDTTNLHTFFEQP